MIVTSSNSDKRFFQPFTVKVTWHTSDKIDCISINSLPVLPVRVVSRNNTRGFDGFSQNRLQYNRFFFSSTTTYDWSDQNISWGVIHEKT